MKLNKKGFTLNEVPSLAIALLVVAIVIGIGATVLVNMQETSTMTDSLSRQDLNSSFVALTNTTAVNFANAEWQYTSAGYSYLTAGSCADVVIYNRENAVATTNFTVSGCTAVLLEGPGNNSAFTASYNFSATGYNRNYNITQSGLSAQVDFSEWQSTWVVVLAAAVIIGIVGKYLFFK